MMSFQQLKESLLQNDEGFRQLADQHCALDARLGELAAQHYSTGADALEIARLKKRKLQLKDHMEAILRRRSTVASMAATLQPETHG
jgi:uncharacterized protein YdcH (DUF465 family)